MNAYVHALSRLLSVHRRKFERDAKLFARYRQCLVGCEFRITDVPATWEAYASSEEFSPLLDDCKRQASAAVPWMDPRDYGRPAAPDMLVALSDKDHGEDLGPWIISPADDSVTFRPYHHAIPQDFNTRMEDYHHLGGRLARAGRDHLASEWIRAHANDPHL